MLANEKMIREVNETHDRKCRFIIPRTVVEELSKKGVGLKERAAELGLSGHYEIFEDHDPEIAKLALRLPVHYPDNLIVASAIASGAILLTFDNAMRTTALRHGASVAEFSSWHEGLSVWSPGDFGSKHFRRGSV
jgi:rRNA-processing protein FCF1